MLSGDIEPNPGPIFQGVVNNNLSCCENLSMDVLRMRLHEHGLIPFDVGGGGDCFFRAVSHQMFGSSLHHLAIRRAGVQYMRNHPEQFIEYVIDQSWVEYLFAMSRQGTWCDAAAVQGVAECYNLSIHIIESGDNFHPSTVINPQYAEGLSRRIYIGHLDEFHYVSTMENECVVDNEAEECNIRVSGCFDDVSVTEDVVCVSRERNCKRSRIDVESDDRRQRSKKLKKVLNDVEVELDGVDKECNVDLDIVNNRLSGEEGYGNSNKNVKDFLKQGGNVDFDSIEKTCSLTSSNQERKRKQYEKERYEQNRALK